MNELTIGARRYRILTARRGPDWLARAEQIDSGDPFGIECAGASESDSVERMKWWLEWQHEHATALECLQQAEQVYYRTVASGALATASLDSASLELRIEALAAVESARLRLDDIRLRRPD